MQCLLDGHPNACLVAKLSDGVLVPGMFFQKQSLILDHRLKVFNLRISRACAVVSVLTSRIPPSEKHFQLLDSTTVP